MHFSAFESRITNLLLQSKDRDKKSKEKDKYRDERRKKKDYRERSPERNDKKYKETEESTEPSHRVDRRHRSSSRNDSYRRSSDRKRSRESRDRYHRRSTSRSNSRRRSKSYRRSPSREGDKAQRLRKEGDKEETSLNTKSVENASETHYKPITLKDVMSANPGITLPEAVIKLNAYNSAVARGEQPPPISNAQSSSSSLSSVLPSGLSLTAAGGLSTMPDALTKPHREL